MGKKEKIYSFDEEKSLVSSIYFYEYDKDGNLDTVSQYSVNGEYIRTSHYLYDGQNRLVKYFIKEREDVRQEHNYYTIYIYDKNDRITREEVYIEGEEDIYSYYEHEYDDSVSIKVSYYIGMPDDEGAVLSFYYKNEYDEEGRLSRRNHYDSNGKLKEYFLTEYID